MKGSRRCSSSRCMVMEIGSIMRATTRATQQGQKYSFSKASCGRIISILRMLEWFNLKMESQCSISSRIISRIISIRVNIGRGSREIMRLSC